MFLIGKLSSSRQAPTKFNLNWDLHYSQCETRLPTQLFPLLEAESLVWKIHLIKLDQLAKGKGSKRIMENFYLIMFFPPI